MEEEAESQRQGSPNDACADVEDKDAMTQVLHHQPAPDEEDRQQRKPAKAGSSQRGDKMNGARPRQAPSSGC